MKRFILLVVIIAIAFTACSKKSETATIVTADRYAKILNGDLSDFAGTWVNAEGHKTQLSSNGLFDLGTWGDRIVAYGFEKTGDGINSVYSWHHRAEGDGYGVTLYPAGTEVVNYDGNILQSDITKVRIYTGFGSDPKNYVFYREGEAPAASQSKVWEPAELTGEWHSRTITGSCHGQEHYIFTADGYYRKGDLYQKHDGTWTLVIDAATGKYHLTLQYKQFIDFESGWSPNEFTEYSEYETIDPNNISLLLHGTGWVELTRCNNPGWSAQ